MSTCPVFIVHICVTALDNSSPFVIFWCKICVSYLILIAYCRTMVMNHLNFSDRKHGTLYRLPLRHSAGIFFRVSICAPISNFYRNTRAHSGQRPRCLRSRCEKIKKKIFEFRKICFTSHNVLFWLYNYSERLYFSTKISVTIGMWVIFFVPTEKECCRKGDRKKYFEK